MSILYRFAASNFLQMHKTLPKSNNKRLINILTRKSACNMERNIERMN